MLRLAAYGLLLQKRGETPRLLYPESHFRLHPMLSVGSYLSRIFDAMQSANTRLKTAPSGFRIVSLQPTQPCCNSVNEVQTEVSPAPSRAGLNNL